MVLDIKEYSASHSTRRSTWHPWYSASRSTRHSARHPVELGIRRRSAYMTARHGSIVRPEGTLGQGGSFGQRDRSAREHCSVKHIRHTVRLRLTTIPSHTPNIPFGIERVVRHHCVRPTWFGIQRPLYLG